MLKALKKFLISFLDYIAPQRVDASLVNSLEEKDILKLPKAGRVENMPWIQALFHYKNNSVRAIVWEIKYRGNTSPLGTISKLLHEEIISAISDIKLFDAEAKILLVPIPISQERRLSRGFNQSEYIAKSILPLDNEHVLLYAPQWFQKIKDTPIQSKSLSRMERMKNLIGCFEANPQVSGAYIILIDDVVTTGTTLSEARTTLLSAGARDVFAFTIAH